MDYFFESRLSCSWSLSANTIFELLYLAWLTTTLSRWTIVLSTPQWPPRYLDWITTLLIPTYVSYFSFYYDFGYLEGLIELDRPIRLSETWRWSFYFLVASCEFPLLLTVFCPAFKLKEKPLNGTSCSLRRKVLSPGSAPISKPFCCWRKGTRRWECRV